MDEYLDQFFSSSSWECCESDKPNEMLLSSIVVEEDESNSSPTYLTNSNPSMESLAAQDASSFVHDLDSDAQDDAKNSNTNLPNPMPDGSFQVENMGFPYDVNQLPLNCDSFDEDFETLSQISQQWPLQSLEDVVPSLSPYNIYDMGSNAYNLSGLGTTENGKQDLQNYPLPSFASAPQIAMPMSGLQPLPQAENLTTTSSGECKTGKPRMRARRGQATDPHSIAERLRREKIADRMKNLQELVPNSNKTDKASMLDEIIEYVKFLQLQVKALSTSRQGTQQAKGANGSLMSPPIGQGGDIYSNEIAIEQLVRLMESDGSKAMQHLQNKGLFLIPISLAEAISTEKESSSSSSSSPAHPPDSDDNGKKKAGSGDAGLVHNSRSSSSSSSNSSSSSSLLPEVKQEVKNSNSFSLLPEK